MTEHRPAAPRLTRRRRYAIAALPLMLVHPAFTFAQDVRLAQLSTGNPSSDIAPPRGAEPADAGPAERGIVMPQPAPPVPGFQPVQGGPPMAPMPEPPDADATEVVDPPSRVGRLARMVGRVSYRAPGQDDWTPAQMNFSVTPGTGFWTEPGARSAIEVNGSRIALDSSTDFRIAELTDAGMVATLPQGQAFFRLRGLLPDEKFEVVTPRGSLTMVRDGRYLVEAGDDTRPTRMSAFDGEATARGEGFDTPIPSGQTLVLIGAGVPQGSWQPARAGTPLMAWAATLESKGPPVPESARQMTGAETLSQYGRWTRHQDYGDVWYPRVEQGWAPYRQGQWVWRDPWGWTWVDEQPWGFAPSHYGRWVQVGPQWAWAPQPVYLVSEPGYIAPRRPYWAPALVTFFAGAVVVGALARPVGWIPLGPREPYYPWWRASPRYVQNVNYRNVPSVVVVNNYWRQNVVRPGPPTPLGPGFGLARDPNQFRNYRGATLVPGDVLTGSRRVGPAARPFTPALLGPNAAPVIGALPMAPTAATRGLTPGGAQRLGVAPPPPPSTRVPGPPPVRHEALLGEGGPPVGPGARAPGGGISPGVAAGVAGGVAAGAVGAALLGGRRPSLPPGAGNVPPPPGFRPGGGAAPGFGPGTPSVGTPGPGFGPGGARPGSPNLPPAVGARPGGPLIGPPGAGVPGSGGVPPQPGARGGAPNVGIPGGAGPGSLPGVRPGGPAGPAAGTGPKPGGPAGAPGGAGQVGPGGRAGGAPAPQGGFTPPSAQQPRFAPSVGGPGGGVAPPPQQPRFNQPPAGAGGFSPPPQQRFSPQPASPPPQQRFAPQPASPPPQQRFTPAAPPPQRAAPPPPPPQRAAPPPPPPPRAAPPPRPAPPPPQRNPNQR